MNIKGQHIILRAPEQSDLEILYQWENTQDLWKVSNTLAPFSRFVLEQYLMNAHLDLHTNKQLRLMICDINEQAVGCIDLYEFDPHHSRAGVGIVIAKEFRKNGFADDALKTLSKYAFEVLCLHQLYCAIGAENEPSLQLFERNGFQRCGLKKNWIRTAVNSFEDEWTLQLINPSVK